MAQRKKPVPNIHRLKTDQYVQAILAWLEEHYPSKDTNLSHRHIAEAIHDIYGISFKEVKFVLLVGVKALVVASIHGWFTRLPGVFTAERDIKIRLQRRPSGRKLTTPKGETIELKVGVKNVINKDTIPFLPLQYILRFRAARAIKRLAVVEEVQFHEAEDFREQLMKKHLALFAKKHGKN